DASMSAELHALDGALVSRRELGTWHGWLPTVWMLHDTGEPLEPDDRLPALDRIDRRHNRAAGVVDLRSGKPIFAVARSPVPLDTLGASAAPPRVALSPSGERLAVVSSDGRVAV